MLTSMKFVAPIALGAMLMTSVASTGASAAVSFNPSLASQPSSEASVEKVWWRGGGWRGGAWRGGWGRGWGYRGVGVRFGGYGWRRGGNWCYWHPRACSY